MPQEELAIDVGLDRVDRFEQIMTVYGRELILSLVALIVGLLIVRWVMKLVRKVLARMFKNTATSATVGNVIHILLLSTVFIGAASEAGLNILPVFRLFMVTLLVVTGLMVFLRPYIPTLPFKVGQTVKAAGLLGKVEATTFLNTRIRTFDGKVFFVPNRTIINDIVINYHYTPTRRIKVDVPIRYDQDLIFAKQVLEAVMIADPRVKKTPRPSVWVMDLSNGCVMLGGRCWADNPKYWSTRVDLVEKAKLRFDYEGIVISYPHLGVHPFNTSAENSAFEKKFEAGRSPRSPEPVEDEM